MQQLKYEVTFGGIWEKVIEVWAFTIEEAIQVAHRIANAEASKGAIVKIEQVKSNKEL